MQYYINAKTSTQTHLFHSAKPIWYKDIRPPKLLYFNFYEAHIIGATILIASLINLAFDQPGKHHMASSTVEPDQTKTTSTTTDTMLRLFKSHLISLASGFSTMNDALNFSVKDILYN